MVKFDFVRKFTQTNEKSSAGTSSFPVPQKLFEHIIDKIAHYANQVCITGIIPFPDTKEMNKAKANKKIPRNSCLNSSFIASFLALAGFRLYPGMIPPRPGIDKEC